MSLKGFSPWSVPTLLSLSLLASCSSAPPPRDESAKARSSNEQEKVDFASLREAQARLEAHNPREALPLIESVLKRYESQNGSGKRRYSARSHTESLLYLIRSASAKEAAVVMGPAWADAYLLKGYCLIELGMFVEARSALEQGVAIAPHNSALLSELGFTYQLERNWSQMLVLFSKAVDDAKLSPEFEQTKEQGRALRGKGFALIELDRLDEAEEAFKKAFVINPNDDGAKSEMAHISKLRHRPR